MNSDKRNRARESEMRAQQKFNGRFYKEKKEPDFTKRAFFRFWDVFFDNLGTFFGVNVICALVGLPIVLLSYMTVRIIFDSAFAEYASMVPAMLILIIVIGTFLLGAVNCAAVYITRCCHENRKGFFFSDFKSAFKSNYKQSLFYGFCDAMFIFALIFVIWTFNSTDKLDAVVVIIAFLVMFIYYTMRVYAYLQIVTISLKLPQISRNAFFLMFLGLKNNLLSALLGVLVIGGAGYLLMNTESLWVLLTLGVLALTFGISLVCYIQVACAYGPFNKHLIAPELEAEKAAAEAADAEQAAVQPEIEYAPDELDDPPEAAADEAEKNPDDEKK